MKPNASVEHLGDFPVLELRRYLVKPEKRADFAALFDTLVPEAFQQLGALIFGQFLERENPSGFAWIRGYKSMEARLEVKTAFYDGPLWKEHAQKINECILDIENVLLLRPLRSNTGIPVLPAVDPTEKEGARGLAVAQIFAVEPDQLEAFGQQAEALFKRYRLEGVREAGVLVTLEEPNNFPRHPVRTDGPHLVWLGLVENEEILETHFGTQLRQVADSLAGENLLRVEPETVVLEPTRRSRLRWI